jgi:hypothetical protein
MEERMRKLVAVSIITLAGALTTAGAFAQGSAAPQGGTQMPMQQGQGGMSCCPCPMMQRSAAVENRLRQLEERAGIPAPAQPDAPATPR